MGKVIAYGRVSSQRQADQGALERQERQLLEGVTADEILMDVGSGKTTARPAYQRLLRPRQLPIGPVAQCMFAARTLARVRDAIDCGLH